MVTGLNDLDRENGAQWTISELAALADDPSYTAGVDYANLHLNIDDPNISPNDKHLILVNSGNDDALKAYMDDISASNSGRSSNLNSGTAELGDAMMQAPENSVHDPKMHRDTAFSSKAERAEERQANHHSSDDPPATANEVKPPENTFAQGPAGPTFNMGKFV